MYVNRAKERHRHTPLGQLIIVARTARPTSRASGPRAIRRAPPSRRLHRLPCLLPKDGIVRWLIRLSSLSPPRPRLLPTLWLAPTLTEDRCASGGAHASGGVILPLDLIVIVVELRPSLTTTASVVPRFHSVGHLIPLCLACALAVFIRLAEARAVILGEMVPPALFLVEPVIVGIVRAYIAIVALDVTA